MILKLFQEMSIFVTLREIETNKKENVTQNKHTFYYLL
jgi:hypothetical protein